MRDFKDLPDMMTPVDNLDETIKEVVLDHVDVVSVGTALDINDDYIFAREKIVTSIVRSSEVLDAAVIEVKLAASPKNIEAAAAIAKNLNDATGNLLKLHKEFRIIEKPDTKEDADENDSETDGISTSLTDILNAIELKTK